MLRPRQISVLLLDGHSLASLAFMRSLARAGIRVTVGAASSDAPARFSRFCAQFLLYPSPMEQPKAFRQWLFEILGRCQFDLLIGTTDQTMLLLDEWRELLSLRVKVPLPAQESFRLACDKAKTLKQAQALGLAIPPTCFVQNEKEFDHAANSLSASLRDQASQQHRVLAGSAFPPERRIRLQQGCATAKIFCPSSVQPLAAGAKLCHRLREGVFLPDPRGGDSSPFPASADSRRGSHWFRQYTTDQCGAGSNS